MPLDVQHRRALGNLKQLRLLGGSEHGLHVLVAGDELQPAAAQLFVDRAVVEIGAENVAAKLAAERGGLDGHRRVVGKAEALYQHVFLPDADVQILCNNVVGLHHAREQHLRTGLSAAAQHILREAGRAHQRLHDLVCGHKGALALNAVYDAVSLKVVQRVAHGHSRRVVLGAEIALGREALIRPVNFFFYLPEDVVLDKLIDRLGRTCAHVITVLVWCTPIGIYQFRE